MGEARIGQGRDAAKQYLKDNPDVAEKLEADIRSNADKLTGGAPKAAPRMTAAPAAAPAASAKGVDVSAEDFDG